MAKKKTTEVIENSAETEIVAPACENPAQTEAQESPAPEIEQQESEVITEQTVKEDMIPDYAKRVLRLYPNMKEMYISRNGGAFPADTKQSLVGNAILYQNPFYKS
jgi:hypothetical protein